jgi:hypothetical protein
MDVQQLLGSLASIAIVTGVIVAALQLRALRAQRQQEMVLRAYVPFLEENLVRAYWRVHNWDYTTYADFEARASLEDWTDMDQVTTSSR